MNYKRIIYILAIIFAIWFITWFIYSNQYEHLDTGVIDNDDMSSPTSLCVIKQDNNTDMQTQNRSNKGHAIFSKSGDFKEVIDNPPANNSCEQFVCTNDEYNELVCWKCD